MGLRNYSHESITKFMLLISSKGTNNQSVSFTELARLFNEKFPGIEKDD